MNEKQKKALTCLDEIEQYAKQQKLSTRILDAIDDCKKQIAADDTKWNKVNSAVEDILQSMEQKTAPASVYKDKSQNEISIQDIKTQITRMAERCHAENESSIGMLAERKNAILAKTYREIQEISYVKAHAKEIQNEDSYLEFYNRVKNQYEANAFQLIREMLGDISSNYNHMLEHMKSMFQSIGGYAAGIGNRKFYYEYTEKKEGLDKKIQSEAESLRVGGSEILSFGMRTKEAAKEIKKKITRKTNLQIWAPVLLVLALLLIGFSVKTIRSIKENKAAIEREEETVNSEAGADPEAREDSEIKEIADDVMNVVETMASSKMESGMPGALENLKTILIATALAVALYILYIAILKAGCRRQINGRCGEFLKTETIQFVQGNPLMPKLEDAMKSAAEEYESQYLVILNSIFAGTNVDFDDSKKEEQNRFAALKKEWNAIRYE